jgi:transposase-like protein
MLSNEFFMPDEKECAETLRQIRWANGITCVVCRSCHVKRRTEIYRDHYCRYECLDCGRWFNDLSGTVFENSKIPLRYWFYATREMDKGLPTTKIAEAIPFSYPATLNMVHRIRRSQDHHRIRERLSGEVEIDDIHIKTGRQGLKCDHRPPRKRGMKARGRGRYETDRPLVAVWVTRGGPGMAIEMCRDAGSRTLSKATLKHVVPGSRLDTDTWKGYNWLGSYTIIIPSNIVRSMWPPMELTATRRRQSGRSSAQSIVVVPKFQVHPWGRVSRESRN